MTCAAPLLPLDVRAEPVGDAKAASLFERRLPMMRGAAGAPEIFSDFVSIVGVQIRLAGIALDVDGESVTGSAASLHGDPLPRAQMELLERVAITDAIRSAPLWKVLFNEARKPLGAVFRARVFPMSPEPSTFRWARSNGVAAGASWSDAAKRARWELIERDRVLRSWFGEILPVRLDCSESIPPALTDSYDFEAHSFGGNESGAAVVGLFGFPRHQEPMVYGFGARDTTRSAIAAAAAECIQRLGFLWNEAVPVVPPVHAPTPDFHQEYFLYPGHRALLRAWLDGRHLRFRGLLREGCPVQEPTYADLTPAGSGADFSVVKAMPRGHVPLLFGSSHPLLRAQAPAELAVHPIT